MLISPASQDQRLSDINFFNFFRINSRQFVRIRVHSRLAFPLRLCGSKGFLPLLFASSQELEAGSFFLLQHCLHNLDLSPLSIVGIGGEVK